jgi:hypothetical protein
MVGDVFHRGDLEEIKLPFPYATYGVGREIAGMNGRGSGSFGSAQAKACSHDEFGMLPVDYAHAPQPSIVGNWAKWTESQELNWSHPREWPISRSQIEPDARKFGFHKIARARTALDVKQGLAQGYGVTIASMYGSTRMQVQGSGDNAVLVADWNTRWAHQMSVFGYWEHPQLGDLWPIQNQWGTSVHPRCPQLEPLGITGAFWMRGSDFDKIIRSESNEVFLHSSTGGFPIQTIDWEKLSYIWNYPPFA